MSADNLSTSDRVNQSQDEVNREIDYFVKKGLERDYRVKTYMEQQLIISRMSPIDYEMLFFKEDKLDAIGEIPIKPDNRYISGDDELVEYILDEEEEDILHNSDLMIKDIDY